MSTRLIQAILLTLCAAICGSCDQDPFGLAERRIAGPYTLSQLDGVRYGIEGPLRSSLKDLLVHQLAWNGKWIIAHVAGEGWFVIDLTRRKDTGPISEDEARRKLEELQLELHSAEQAWRLLAQEPRNGGKT